MARSATSVSTEVARTRSSVTGGSAKSATVSKTLANVLAWREQEILDWMRGLTHEKDRLRRSHQGRPQSTVDAKRLQEIESTLDQCWDLVRQRRARRAAGQSWDDLSQRVADLVRAHRP